MPTAAPKKFFSQERFSRLPSSILLAVVLSIFIFVVAPFEIYCNNLAEFKFSIGDFIGILSLFALTVAVAITAILYFIPKCVYNYVYPAFVGILLMFFLQTNFLNGSLSSLAGDDMEPKTPIFTYVFNTFIWLAVIALVIVLFKLRKTSGITATAALVLTIAVGASQLANFAMASVSTEGVFDSAIDRVYGEYSSNPRFLTDKDVEKFGSDRNVIVFCVDRFDTKLYCEPAMEKYPETFEKLDGFTFYNDATSIYGNTFPAVGYMMSGIKYHDAACSGDNYDHRHYFNSVYNENKTLSALADAGYSIKLYSEEYYDYYHANELPEYVANSVETTKDNVEIDIRRPFKFGLAISRLSLYRSLPFVFKNIVGRMNSDTCNEYVLYHGKDFGAYKSYFYDNKKAYNMIKKKVGEFCVEGEKNFTFIHIAGCHTADYDANWKKNNGKSVKDYVDSAKISIDIVNLYLENMKAISPEIYHNSTIVILGDHGKVADRHKNFRDSMLTALFVKPSGVSGEALKSSSAPVSHENLWATIFQSEGIDYDRAVFGESVFDVEALSSEAKRQYIRKFIWNKRTLDHTSYYCVEYEIEGEARDFDNWTKVNESHHNHPLFAN